VVCGLVFGGSAGLKVATELGIANAIGSLELMLMGSAAASLCAWWALGFIMRAFVQSWPPGPIQATQKGANEQETADER
jgi:hypothetical protein